ncbi:hypothetical protein STRTUCAR8_00165 [Streptomyces turgidiscabies Car8]|uniref:Uncharacterized protein n=1 Tax=Streptomyces turgidiscabies (strain Car8) TaxID=698760 RepID=L7EZ26_STRT8|nr:hypothetical protein STRTUCAR8_00165 [Streptomyces turgidiscabies Car8]
MDARHATSAAFAVCPMDRRPPSSLTRASSDPYAARVERYTIPARHTALITARGRSWARPRSLLQARSPTA